ncbi:MAG: hypothetical protein ACE5Z5_12045 [Candidatus Bathyarchaeia archaeon]
MPVKVTKEQVDRIVYLRDEEKWPWKRISGNLGLDEKTCRKHYALRKAERGPPRGEGALQAEAFKLFDQGGRPDDAVRQLQIPLEDAKQLYEEYLEMKEQEEGRGEELPVSEEYEAFKRRESLAHMCDELLDMLDVQFEDTLTGEGDLMRKSITFLKERLQGVMNLGEIEKLRELLKSERRKIKALLKRDNELYEKRREREKERKKEWVIRSWMDQGMSEEEARKHLEEMIDLHEDGSEGVYRLEKEMERCEAVRNECLRYMSLRDYNRLSLLFLESIPPADYLIRFWRQEQDIVARYGEAGWKELNLLYQTHRDTLVKERPELRKAFTRYLWRRGLQPCPYCNLLINVVGAPQQFRCPRCGGPLVRDVYPT